MIKWTFAFEESHIAVEVRDEAEDKRIAACLETPDLLLYAPGQGRDAYVNLRAVKVVIREEINEEALKDAQEAAPATGAGAPVSSGEDGPGA